MRVILWMMIMDDDDDGDDFYEMMKMIIRMMTMIDICEDHDKVILDEMTMPYRIVAAQ